MKSYVDGLMKCCRKIVDDIETFNDPVARRHKAFIREMLPLLRSGFVVILEKSNAQCDVEPSSNGETGINVVQEQSSSLLDSQKISVKGFFKTISSSVKTVTKELSKELGASGIISQNAASTVSSSCKGELIMITMDEEVPPVLRWLTLKNEKNLPKARGVIPLRLIQLVVMMEEGRRMALKTHTGEILLEVSSANPSELRQLAQILEESLVVRAPEIEDDAHSLQTASAQHIRYQQLQEKIKTNEQRKIELGLTGVGMQHTARIMMNRQTAAS